LKKCETQIIYKTFIKEIKMTNKNSEILRKAHNHFSVNNLTEALKLLAPGIKFTDHGKGISVRSRSEFLNWMENLKKSSSDVKLVDAIYIESGDWVTARFRAIGKQDGMLEQFLPSNKEFSLDVCEVWHFNSKGEADEGHNYSDSLGMLIQLGHIQQPV
jgi:SnoaL-like domain